MKTMKLLPLKIAVTSAMIFGLGAASTVNAQAQSNESLDTHIQALTGQANFLSKIEKRSPPNNLTTDEQKRAWRQQKINERLSSNQQASLVIMKALNENITKNKDDIKASNGQIESLKTLYGNAIRTVGNNESNIKTNKDAITKNKDDIAAHKKEADANFETLTKNQNALIEENEAINRELEGFAAHADVQDKQILQNQDDIAAHKKEADANFETLTKNQNALIEENEAQDRLIEDLAAYNELQDAYAKQQTEAIDALNKASSANTDRIATAELGIAENKKDAQIAKAQANENKDSIAKNQADIQLHDQKINNLGILHTMVARAVGNNTQGVATNKADIAKNNESIEDLYEANAENVERLTQVDNNVFVNRLNIQELKRKQENDIKDVVGMQNAIAEQADKNKNHIQDLAKAQLAGVEVMDELNKNVEKNKADADANFETLTKNQNTLIEKDKEHDKLITANKTAIDANKASADAKFAATTDALTKHGQDITKNAKSITDLGTKVNGFDGRISALDTKVNGFDGRISALDTKVNAFDGRITALDSKVENGMASQAALSGLFQPYSVGKFNATAALGGYGSKSAVAIGAGYRVNPNLAFKAGAAINTSGDKKGSYNIGVNYEF